METFVEVGTGWKLLAEVTVALTSAQRIHTGFSGMCRIGGIQKKMEMFMSAV
jgi:hypothetical protein